MEPVFGVLTAFLVAVGPLAIGVTKAVDTVRNLVDSDASLPKVSWNVAAFVFGVALCVGWQFNLVGTLAHAVPALANSARFDGVAGQVLTGLAVGGVSAYWHERMSSLSADSE